MKKLTISILIAAVAALAFAGLAMAQTPITDALQYGNGNGNGSRNSGTTGDEILHDYIMDYFAGVFETSADDLNARLDDGESMADIAISFGYTVEELNQMMDDARLYALDAALADGVITQDQYDLMLNAGSGYAANNTAQTQSRGNGGSGTQNRTQDNTGPVEDCPYYTPTN